MKTDIAGVTNPGFELFLLLHIEGSYEQWIEGQDICDLKGKVSSNIGKIIEEIINEKPKG